MSKNSYVTKCSHRWCLLLLYGLQWDLIFHLGEIKLGRWRQRKHWIYVDFHPQTNFAFRRKFREMPTKENEWMASSRPDITAACGYPGFSSWQGKWCIIVWKRTCCKPPSCCWSDGRALHLPSKNPLQLPIVSFHWFGVAVSLQSTCIPSHIDCTVEVLFWGTLCGTLIERCAILRCGGGSLSVFRCGRWYSPAGGLQTQDLWRIEQPATL